MLTVLADDPFEVTSLGNESDTITHGVKYDQNLMLFGTNRQYILPGRLPLSPTNALLPVISSHKGAADTAPIEAGGLVFYAKHGDISSSVWQIEPGRHPESPEAYPISEHISRYISGQTAELLALPKQDQITQHFCIQGWSGLAKWSGVPMSVICDLVEPALQLAD